MNESDDILMERAAMGSAEAFDQIVRRHQDRLQRFATRMLGGDSARGADIAVGALLRLWESRGAFQPCGQLGAWLLRTANRLCLDLLTRERPACPIDENEPDSRPGVQQGLELSARAQAVRDTVMELPETHRGVLVLSVYEGMSYQEIAESLEISMGTVASRKNHAVAMLRRRLAAWEDR
jgi:RNA polymerase sigma-70 factor (ECF subfamily)